MSPCLLLYASSPIDAVSILRSLGCVSRYPVLLASSGLSGLPPELRPTRLLSRSDSQLDRVLAALQFPGFGIEHRGVRQVSGATAVFVGDAELKSSFADTCLWMSVPPLPRLFSAEDEDREMGSIEKLQNRLLMYRLRNFSEVNDAQFDAPDFVGSTRQLVRTLGRCIVGAPDVQSRLLDFATTTE